MNPSEGGTAADPILLRIEAGVARITLNRPERLNALNEGLLSQFAAALDQIESTQALRVVVITGAGRGFCAGADLSSGFAGGPDSDIGIVLERSYNPLIQRLRALEVPVLAVVNGVAAGAGASFALACDIVLAGTSARFVLAFARIGLVPDAGLTYFLSERVGLARAMGMALLGEELNAEDALSAGLIYKVCADQQLAKEAELLIQRLATAPTRALGLTKQALYAAQGHQLVEQLHLERQLQSQMGRTDDFREGVEAFREKRAARFRGR
jgi:2-(1,2-epoxy-1,2-dihydrophenyl)acetyl-CoA isomerase